MHPGYIKNDDKQFGIAPESARLNRGRFTRTHAKKRSRGTPRVSMLSVCRDFKETGCCQIITNDQTARPRSVCSMKPLLHLKKQRLYKLLLQDQFTLCFHFPRFVVEPSSPAARLVYLQSTGGVHRVGLGPQRHGLRDTTEALAL